MPITTKVVSWNPVHGEVYSIQHCAIKFVSYCRKVGGFRHFQQYFSYIVAVRFIIENTGVPGENHRLVASD